MRKHKINTDEVKTQKQEPVFFLRSTGVLEKLADSATPKKNEVALTNANLDRPYFDWKGNLLMPTPKYKGQRQYEFPENYTVIMEL